MGDKSKIEWTDATWNPVTGCTKVSQGCKHCYAERVFPRPYPGRDFTDVRCHPERLEQPLRWKTPRLIFVNSMSDLFHEKVPFEFIDRVFETICGCQGRHTFQILTKRPERALAWFGHAQHHYPGWFSRGVLDLWQTWIGVSVEDQKTADERIPLLLQTPAAVRFLSCEPLLGPVDLHAYLGGVDVAKEYRRKNISSGDDGNLQSGRPGTNLERRTQSGARSGEIPYGPLDEQPCAIPCSSSSPCLETLSRPNTNRVNNQPQGWTEEAQPPGEFRISNSIGTDDSCLSDRVERRIRREKSSDEVDKQGDRGDPQRVCEGAGDTTCTREEIPYSLSNRLKNSTGGEENERSGNHSELHASKTKQQANTRRIWSISQVIVGGESGPHARPMHPEWARSIRDQCVAAQVPLFFKQWGEFVWWADQISVRAKETIRLTRKGNNGSDLANACDGGDVWMYRVGKKASGALLDGREWREFPHA